MVTIGNQWPFGSAQWKFGSNQWPSVAISGHQRDRTSPRSTGIQGELMSTMASSIGGTQSHWSTSDGRRQEEDIRRGRQKGSSEPLVHIMLPCTHTLDSRMALVARAHGVRADRPAHLARLALLATCQIERMHAHTRQSPWTRHHAQKASKTIRGDQGRSPVRR